MHDNSTSLERGDTAYSELRTYRFGSDWLTKPELHNLQDINNDQVPDLLIYGENTNGSNTLQRYSGASINLIN